MLALRCAERRTRGTDLSSLWASVSSLAWNRSSGNCHWPVLVLGRGGYATRRSVDADADSFATRVHVGVRLRVAI